MIAVRRLAASAVVVAGLAASGCGVDIDAAEPVAASATPGTQAAHREVRRRAASLPERPAGELAISGERGSLSRTAVDDFQAARPRVKVRHVIAAPAEGFARLCRGETDVVESSRTISRTELAVCDAAGVEIRAPIQIASDAIVLATHNESDVGGDCVTVEGVRAMYRRGSTVGNWSRLGFDDLPLTVAGPAEDSTAFSFFASAVLGVPTGGSLDDVRGDYAAHGSDDAIRKDIVGEDRARRVPATVEAELREARASLASQRRVSVGDAVVHVRERVLRAIASDNRRRARRGEAVADPAALARRNRARVDDAKRLAARRARARFDTRFQTLRVTRTRELLGRARRTGVVGFVRFGYYEAYEDQLRPLEIDAGPAHDAAVAAADRRSRAAGVTPPRRLPATDEHGNRSPNCVFPSQLTIQNGEYPLSRHILLYASRRGLQRREVRDFLAYTLAHAQTLATRSRLVPITDTLRADQYEVVTGSPLTPSAAAARVPAGAKRATTAVAPREAAPGPAEPAGIPGVSSGVSADPHAG